MFFGFGSGGFRAASFCVKTSTSLEALDHRLMDLHAFGVALPAPRRGAGCFSGSDPVVFAPPRFA